jgi:threonylcarbamoyladenosine tRNA methylthiotransferase MtaB
VRVGITTMGCRSNFADTTDLQLALVGSGVEPVNFTSDADVYVINTCTVTDTAEKEVRSHIQAAKKKGARVVVTGCLATVGSDVFKDLESTDLVIPPGQRTQLLKAILSGEGKNDGQVKAIKRSERHTSEDINSPLGDALVEPSEKLGESTLRKRFHLRVQEGCDNFCTFCIIPFTRGKVVSRSVARIKEDLSLLADKGFEEVVLTGTHLGGYGKDLGSSLLGLLQEIARHPNRPSRIRLSSLDPDDVDFKLIDYIASEPSFCHHLHICLQALDAKILKLMNRPYSLEHALSLLNYSRKILPAASLGTDLITGFPGETGEIFDQQAELLEELPLSYLHVFPYSERTGTAATKLNGEVGIRERKIRGQRLRSISQRKERQFSHSFIGKKVELILETKSEDGEIIELKGTTREFVSGVVVVRKSDYEENFSSNLKLGKCLEVTAEEYIETKEVLRCVL